MIEIIVYLRNMTCTVYSFEHLIKLLSLHSYVLMQLDPGGGGTSIETLYRDVPPKWVGFWQKIPKHGSHFWPPNP